MDCRVKPGNDASYKRRLHGRLAGQPGRDGQIFRAQGRGVEQLRLIARTVVGEDRDDGVAGAEILGESYRARDVDAARAAEAKALVFEQIEQDRHGFLVADQIRLLDLDVFDDRGDAAKPDAFGDRTAFARLRLAVGEQIVHRGAARVGAADHDVLLHLAQERGNAGKRAAGADRADEAVDLAVGLLPDFRAGRDVMRTAVIEIIPLIGEDDAVRLILAQLIGKAAADVLVIVR